MLQNWKKKMNLYNLLNNNELNLGITLNYKKDTIIFYEQDKAQGVYFILDGEIKISSYNKDGNEIIYNNLKKGDIFANALIFSSNPIYLGNVETKTNVTLFFLCKQNLIKILNQNTSFLLMYLEKLSDEIIKTKKILKLSTQKTIKEKLIYYLKLNNYEINMSVTQLSSLLFVERPSLSRIIKELIKDNILKKEGKKITLIKNI